MKIGDVVGIPARSRAIAYIGDCSACHITFTFMSRDGKHVIRKAQYIISDEVLTDLRVINAFTNGNNREISPYEIRGIIGKLLVCQDATFNSDVKHPLIVKDEIEVFSKKMRQELKKREGNAIADRNRVMALLYTEDRGLPFFVNVKDLKIIKTA